MPNHIRNIIEIDTAPERVKTILQSIQDDEKGIGSIDFNKILPMPKELEDVEVGSTAKRIVELYLTAINPTVIHFDKRERNDLGEYRIDGNEFVRINNMLNSGKVFGTYNNALPVKEINESIEQIIKASDDRFSDVKDILDYGKSLVENVEKYGHMDWYSWSVSKWGTKWNAYDFDEYHDDELQISFNTAWGGVPNILTALSLQYPDVKFCYSWADEDIGSNVGRETYQDGEVVESDRPVRYSAEAYQMAAEIRDEDLSDRGLYLSADGSTYEYREDEDEFYNELEEDEMEV